MFGIAVAEKIWYVTRVQSVFVAQKYTALHPCYTQIIPVLFCVLHVKVDALIALK